MGLAASQARFLAITSRKANCEFRSMELAQQKLSLTRELESAAADYESALDSTILVWDATGNGDYNFNLTSDLLMTPSDENAYMPYMLSRQDGKIAVNSKYLAAAEGIFNITQDSDGTYSCDGGIIGDDGNIYYRGDEGFEEVQTNAFYKFILGLKENKAISGATADKLIDDNGTDITILFQPDAGVGAEISGRETDNTMTVNSMISYIDYIVEGAKQGYFPTGSYEADLAEKLIFDFNKRRYYSSVEECVERGNNDASKLGDKIYDLRKTLDAEYSEKIGTTWLNINGNYARDYTYTDPDKNLDKDTSDQKVKFSSAAFSLADLLNEDITLAVTGKQNYSNVLELMTHMIQNSSNVNSNLIFTKDVDQWYDEMIASTKEETGGDVQYRSYEELIRYAAGGYYNAKGDWKTSAKIDGKDVDYTKDNANAKGALALINFFDGLAKSMYALLMPRDENGNVIKSKVNENALYTALLNAISRMRNAQESYNSSDFGDYVNLKNKKGSYGFLNLRYDSGRTEAYAKDAIKSAEDYNCWVKNGEQYALSLSNITECFLTDFVNGLEEFQNECLIVKESAKSTYITDYTDHLYNVNTGENNEQGLWESEFYSIIFNNLCTNGWYQNEEMADKKYLDNAIKTGRLFIVSKNIDNYYYQERYAETSGGHVVEKPDDAAIARAEREYAYKKSQINYKEEKIELETKQLDAEISELTTEYETVKSLISNNAKSVFKQFSS